MIVADASAVVDAIAGNPEAAQRMGHGDVHAPHLIDVEVVSALRRLVAAGSLDLVRAEAGLQVLKVGDIVRHPHTPLIERMWELRGSVSMYDASYVALAGVLDAPLVTADRKLARHASLTCVVELV